MVKIDYKKELPHLYAASAKQVEIVTVPTLNFLMIDGAGDPNCSPNFPAAVESLFGVAYTLKFMIKKGASAVDYGVMPLEGLWWAEDMSRFSPERKDDWLWTLMIMQPDPVSSGLVEEAVAQVRKKKNPLAPGQLRFAAFTEGRAAQILHIGPFSEEGPTIQRVHEYIQATGGSLTGKHHEIYLSDLRKATPEKWKTIVRQPLAG